MKKFFVYLILSISVTLYAQRNFYNPMALDEPKFEKSDLGSMWTFDDVPIERFKELYGFEPTEEWLEDVQKSALQFGGGCSAAFVSEDGLIMTNHHCGRGQLPSLSKEGEDLLRDGFYASTLEEERKVPGLFVDQLLFIDDVTAEVQAAIKEGTTDEEKIEKRDLKIKELEAKYSEETGLLCKVVTLYYGGKYSIYGYKRYNDIRLVMVPDFQIAATGWDWDNFTYPRYELDFAFYRAYDENGQPVKTDHYFKFSKKGAEEGELIFTVGRPGNTDRLLTVEQLNYFKESVYPQLLLLFNSVYDAYLDLYKKYPERETDLLLGIMGWGNARKAYAGRLAALKDEYIMKKKIDFQNLLKSKTEENSELKKRYGHIWNAVNNAVEELKSYSKEYMAFRPFTFAQPIYFETAKKVIKYAEQMKLPESEREPDYTKENIEETISSIFPKDYDEEMNYLKLKGYSDFLIKTLGRDHEIIKKYFANRDGDDAANYLLNNSKIVDEKSLKELLASEPDSILNSDDPFISIVKYGMEKYRELSPKVEEVNQTLQVLNQQLGELVFEVFGNSIPPDATSTLRISDGVIKGYEYNGTLAPAKTTFYGLWDRYFSFGGNTYPWGLHERWKNPPKELDLSIPVGFASTNDIVGGNSGSSIINKNAEVVGLVHDGNLESLAGYVIFLPENNRAVATDSYGLLEALKYVYKTDRLVKELENGKM